MAQEERSLISTIRNRQKNWLGHVLRGNSLMKIALEDRIVGKKTVGRPRVMLLNWLLDKSNNCRHHDLAQNRDAWRRWNSVST